MQRALDWTLNRSFVGTPFEAFRDLPEGLHIALEGGAARLPGPPGKTPVRQALCWAGLTWQDHPTV